MSVTCVYVETEFPPIKINILHKNYSMTISICSEFTVIRITWFDIGFCEMMSAYFPEFESVNHATVCQWMFELSAKLHVEVEEPLEKSISSLDLSLPEILPKTKPR